MRFRRIRFTHLLVRRLFAIDVCSSCVLVKPDKLMNIWVRYVSDKSPDVCGRCEERFKGADRRLLGETDDLGSCTCR